MLGTLSQRASAGEVKAREEHQEDRIQKGINSGQLTEREAANLERHEQKIEADRQRALADGRISGKERRKLNREENRQSQRIYHKKHNFRKR